MPRLFDNYDRGQLSFFSIVVADVGVTDGKQVDFSKEKAKTKNCK